jgi:LuxR family maltose regulon positive regulatory protein
MEQVTAKGRRLARRIGSQEIHYAWFETLEAQANLERGEITAVERWAAAKKFSPGEKPHHWHEHEYFTYTRLLIAQERWIDAETLLKLMEESAEQDSRNRKLITIYLLQAILETAKSQREEAIDRLQRALTLTIPQDYRRAFLDEGQAILGLLPEVRHIAPAFVDGLLLELPSEMTPSHPAASLYELLSERELEVLHLVARGYSNRQIAEALFVTLGTVKKHLNNVFSKLQVQNRTQAVAQARELKLLD